jgi:hypothetical protein
MRSTGATPSPPSSFFLRSTRSSASWRPAGWAREDFDDSSWPEAPGGFGTRGTPGAVVRTEWRSPDIWIRRAITLPEGDPKTLALSVHHDEGSEIYLNGVLAARFSGFVSDYDEVTISAEARAALHPGKNVLSVHCHQNGGGQYIDIGVVRQEGRPQPAR